MSAAYTTLGPNDLRVWNSTLPRPPIACLICDLCSSDQSFAYNFLPTCLRSIIVRQAYCLSQPDSTTCFPVATCSCCSARSSRHLDLQRTFTSKSLPSSLSLTGCQHLIYPTLKFHISSYCFVRSRNCAIHQLQARVFIFRISLVPVIKETFLFSASQTLRAMPGARRCGVYPRFKTLRGDKPLIYRFFLRV